MKRKRIIVVKRSRKPGRRPDLKDLPYSLKKDGCTQSTLTSYEKCRMQCHLGLQGWRSLYEKESAVFGGLFHGLLEHFYKAIIRGDVKKGDQHDFFEVWIKKWLRKNAKLDFKGDLKNTPHKLAAQAEPVFAAYCKVWPEDFKRKQWVELEGQFDTNFEGFRLRGMRDGKQYVDGKKTKPRLLETKTKAQVPTHLDLTLRYNTQNLFYLTSLNVDEGNIGTKKLVTKVLYNIIRRPGLKYDGGSLKKFKERIEEHIQKSGYDHYFKRMELNYPAREQAKFRKDLLARLNEFKKWRKGWLTTFKNDAACTATYWCPFIDLCATGDYDEYKQNGRLFVELES